MTMEKWFVAECKNSKNYCHECIGIGSTFCQSIVIGFGLTILSQVLLTSQAARSH